MTEFPSLPLFTDALVADTGHLSDEEFGRYLRLLITMWRLPHCKMPRDDVWHHRRHRVNSEDFNRLYKPILEEFFKCDGNYYYQKRLLQEFTYLKRLRQKQSDNAKLRWNKEKNISQGNAPIPTPNKDNNPLPLLEDLEFEKFYKNFPTQRKGSKENASKGWYKAIKKARPSEILLGLDAYNKSQEVANGYAKGAAAWLNDNGWEFDYTISKKTNGNGLTEEEAYFKAHGRAKPKGVITL